MTFAGPLVYGVYALVEPDPKRQVELLRLGEALMEKTSMAHNRVYFLRFAIDWAIERSNWGEALRYADILARYFEVREKLPYVDLLVSRARLAAALADDPGNRRRDGGAGRAQRRRAGARTADAVPAAERLGNS